MQIDPKQTLDVLTETSLRLTEAADNYGAFKLVFGIFLVLMMIFMTMFIVQTIQLNKKVIVIGEAAQKTIEYFDPIGNRSIGREEAKAAIRENLTRTSTMIKYGVLKIRYENNLTEGSADDRIAGVVTSEYNNRKAFLGRFLVQDKKLSFVCEESDNHTLIELMKEWVYMDREKFTASLMAQGVNYVLDGIKAKYQDKVEELPRYGI